MDWVNKQTKQSNIISSGLVEVSLGGDDFVELKRKAEKSTFKEGKS